MARITIRVEPRHGDISPCSHAVKPSGKPRDPQSGPGHDDLDDVPDSIHPLQR
ncbi:hypothetical protein GCM10010350_71920 [Streptomyces galilaeus]|nr:hypothetical protein GCM10010350_71920 [Streptomyces galilaeus]